MDHHHRQELIGDDEDFVNEPCELKFLETQERDHEVDTSSEAAELFIFVTE